MKTRYFKNGVEYQMKIRINTANRRFADEIKASKNGCIIDDVKHIINATYNHGANVKAEGFELEEG